MINLESVAQNLFDDIVRELDHGATIDIDAIRDAIADGSHEAAENACIYYSACEQVISRYETDPRADTESADDMGAVYKPSEYLNAMRDYAFGIARSIVQAEALGLADELETALDELSDLQVIDMPADAIRLSTDCVHGWAAHDYENESGVCFWVSRQLDGCNAVAIPAAGVWLSYTWE